MPGAITLSARQQPQKRYHAKFGTISIENTFKEIKHQQGEKNSQYGTCWVMKDNENKKIKKEELDTYIQMGWIKGRKIKKSS